MHEPLVTIFTPTYNREDFLPQCIESVLNQTYKNIEYIIVDDASTDNTPEVIRSYNDKRIRPFYSLTNVGNLPISCMAMDKAKGLYMGVVDSDDFLEPTCIEDCVNNIGQAGMIYTKSQYAGDKSGIVPMCTYKYSYENLLRYFMTFHFRLYKTELWHKIKPLTNVYHCWDYDLSLRISEVAEIKQLNKVLYNWRIHDSNIHRDIPSMRKDMNLIKEVAKKRRGLI